MDKSSIDVAVIGKPGCGKSMVIGQLLEKAGAEPEGLAQEIQQHARRHEGLLSFVNKANEGADDIIPWRLETPKFNVTLYEIPDLDSFRDAVSSGMVPVDCALLVISALNGDACDEENDNGATMQFAQVAEELGIHKLAVAITKLDAVHWGEDRFTEIVKDSFRALKHKTKYNLREVPFCPISGVHGDNVSAESVNMPWYRGWTVSPHGSSIKGKTLFDTLDAYTPRN